MPCFTCKLVMDEARWHRHGHVGFLASLIRPSANHVFDESCQGSPDAGCGLRRARNSRLPETPTRHCSNERQKTRHCSNKRQKTTDKAVASQLQSLLPHVLTQGSWLACACSCLAWQQWLLVPCLACPCSAFLLSCLTCMT